MQPVVAKLLGSVVAKKERACEAVTHDGGSCKARASYAHHGAFLCGRHCRRVGAVELISQRDKTYMSHALSDVAFCAPELCVRVATYVQSAYRPFANAPTIRGLSAKLNTLHEEIGSLLLHKLAPCNLPVRSPRGMSGLVRRGPASANRRRAPAGADEISLESLFHDRHMLHNFTTIQVRALACHMYELVARTTDQFAWLVDAVDAGVELVIWTDRCVFELDNAIELCHAFQNPLVSFGAEETLALMLLCRMRELLPWNAYIEANREIFSDEDESQATTASTCSTSCEMMQDARPAASHM